MTPTAELPSPCDAASLEPQYCKPAGEVQLRRLSRRWTSPDPLLAHLGVRYLQIGGDGWNRTVFDTATAAEPADARCRGALVRPGCGAKAKPGFTAFRAGAVAELGLGLAIAGNARLDVVKKLPLRTIYTQTESMPKHKVSNY